MKSKLTTLDNGLRIVSETVADMPSVTLGVWVSAGSRVERDGQCGMAHVLEHMAFKGTTTRSAREIAESIENVGGDINAATSHEQTTYYARVLAEDMALAADILGDILNNSLFDEQELAREKAVIVQEIYATLDSPEELIFDVLQEASFPEQGLGRPISGTPASIQSFSSAGIKNFLQENYIAPRCVIAAAGAVEHEKLVSCIAKNFSTLKNKKPNSDECAEFCGVEKRILRETQQMQLAFSFPGVPYGDENIYAAHVLAGLLGGGMSSRLFQEAREARGLCYNISAFLWPFTDAGVFAMHAATSPQSVPELIPVMLDVMRSSIKNAETGEVERAKAQFKAGMLMAFENTPARAEHLARTLLVHDRVIPSHEIVQRIEAVSVEDVRNYGAWMLSQQNSAFVAIGPEKALPSHQQLNAWGLEGGNA
jgi:predicted Zn-dependent peptidase